MLEMALELASEPPSRAAWESLQLPAMELDDDALEELDSALADWPDELRTVPLHWVFPDSEDETDAQPRASLRIASNLDIVGRPVRASWLREREPRLAPTGEAV